MKTRFSVRCPIAVALVLTAATCLAAAEDKISITQKKNGQAIDVIPIELSNSTVRFTHNQREFSFPLEQLTSDSLERLKAWSEHHLKQDAANDAIPVGKSSFVFEKRDKTIPVMTYRPANFENGPLILVLHGLNRNAGEYRDRAVALGDRFQALIIAPEFDLKQFSTDAYQRGGITESGKVMPAEQWTFRFFSEIIDEVRRREKRDDMPCYIIGHSAGGQILTRMAAFQPDGVTRIIASNPGSLIFPTRDLPFPYGFGSLPDKLGGDEAIQRYLAAPFTLFLGTADTENHNLDESENAKRQGATRIERGRACYTAARELAKARGWKFNWQLVEAEGVGHSSTRMFSHQNAEQAIFGPKKTPTP